MNRRAEARRATRIIKGVAGAAAAEIERFDQELRELADAGRIAHDAALRANREAAFELWEGTQERDDRTSAFVIACAGKFGSSLSALQREFLSLADEPTSDLAKLRDRLRKVTAAEDEHRARHRVQWLVGRLSAELALTADQAKMAQLILLEEIDRHA